MVTNKKDKTPTSHFWISALILVFALIFSFQSNTPVSVQGQGGGECYQTEEACQAECPNGGVCRWDPEPAGGAGANLYVPTVYAEHICQLGGWYCQPPTCENCVPATPEPEASFGPPPYTIYVIPDTGGGTPVCTDRWDIEIRQGSESGPVIAGTFPSWSWPLDSSWAHTFAENPGDVFACVRGYDDCQQIYGEFTCVGPIEPPPSEDPPVCDAFDVSPTSILLGGSVNISWQSTGADSGQVLANSINIYDIPLEDLNNSSTNHSPSTNTTYSATFTNEFGSTNCPNINVTVSEDPPVSDAEGGVGWISMNCLDGGDCSDVVYKVVLDWHPVGNPSGTGDLSGYGWANPKDPSDGGSFGWLKFGELSGFPSGGGTVAQDARIHFNEGPSQARPVKGWARFCSVFESGCSGTLKNDALRGGWDGWLALSGNWSSGVTFSEDDGHFSGYAWGGPVVGWVNFSPPHTYNSETGGRGVYAECLVSEEVFDFSLITENVNLLEGEATNSQVTVVSDPDSTISEEVTISIVSINPSGMIDVNIAGGNSCNPGVGSPCQINLSVSAPLGSQGLYTVNVEGVSDSAGPHSEYFSVNVSEEPPSGGDISCFPDPSFQMVNQPVVWTPDEAGNYYWWDGPGQSALCEELLGEENFPLSQCTRVYPSVGVKDAYLTTDENWSADNKCLPSAIIGVFPFFQHF